MSLTLYTGSGGTLNPHGPVTPSRVLHVIGWDKSTDNHWDALWVVSLTSMFELVGNTVAFGLIETETGRLEEEVGTTLVCV